MWNILPSLRVYVWFWTFLEFLHLHTQLIQEPRKSSASTQGGATKTHKDFQQCIGFFECSHDVNLDDTDTQHKSPQFQESASRPHVCLDPWKNKVQTAVEIKVPLQSRILLQCRSFLSALSRLHPFNELQPLMSNLGKRGGGSASTVLSKREVVRARLISLPSKMRTRPAKLVYQNVFAHKRNEMNARSFSDWSW